MINQNLFRILCGLVESALGRAFDYEAVAQERRCVAGTCVLKQAAFGRELAAEQALADSKMGSFLLLRVMPGMEPIGELVGAIGSAIRESDAAGLVDGDMLYLLMRQARVCDLPIIRERLNAKQIAVEPVDGEDIVALLQHIECYFLLQSFPVSLCREALLFIVLYITRCLSLRHHPIVQCRLPSAIPAPG